MNVPIKYIPKRLSRRDKIKQTKQLKKSRLAYKKGNIEGSFLTRILYLSW